MSLEVVSIKEEYDWDVYPIVYKVESLADLYTDGILKQEPVDLDSVECEIPQQSNTNSYDFEVTVKIEEGVTNNENQAEPDIGASSTRLPANIPDNQSCVEKDSLKEGKKSIRTRGRRKGSKVEPSNPFILKAYLVRLERMQLCKRVFKKDCTVDKTETMGEKTSTCHSCQICGKQFNKSSFLKKHKLCHNEKKNTCKVCGKKFRYLLGLKKHEESHNIKKNACKVCGREFRSGFNLKNHERTHTGEKPHSCKICKRGFAEVINLKRHLRTHTGERPHTCDICKKQFSYKHNLISHIRIHTNEKPYPCDVCKARFGHISDLKRHKRIHSQDRRFSCDICDKTFLRKYYLPLHLKTHMK